MNLFPESCVASLPLKALMMMLNVAAVLPLVERVGGGTGTLALARPNISEESRRDYGIRILWPVNNTVLRTGKIVVYFETHSFAASVDTPIQVRVPQNGPEPALLEYGNAITINIPEPCTQLVTLDATVNGQTLSASVLFSTVFDETKLLSQRFPLPADAVWGMPDHAETWRTGVSSDDLDTELGTTVRANRDEKQSHESGAATPVTDPLNSDHGASEGHTLEFKVPFSSWRQDSRGRVAEDRLQPSIEIVRPPEYEIGSDSGGVLSREERAAAVTQGRRKKPLSLVFVGSLLFDGQSSIWLQQMEGLSRQRFSPTFLTFQRSVKFDETAAQESHSGNAVEQRLRRAGVTLVKMAAPRFEGGWSQLDRFMRNNGNREDDGIYAQGEHNPNMNEAIYAAVLESFDKSGGNPALMSPLWARNMVELVGHAVAETAPDVLILANAKSLGDVVLTRAVRWAMGLRVRIVMDFPNIDPAPGNLAHVLATPSHYVARHPTTAALATAAGAHVVVIPPGVNVVGDSSPISRSRLVGDKNSSSEHGHGTCRAACESGDAGRRQCDPACKVIGYVGRLAPEKGPGLFLAVANELASLMPSARFVVVGDGTLRHAVESLADELGIACLTQVGNGIEDSLAGPGVDSRERLIRFTGWASPEDTQRLLPNMDVLLNPSQTSETFSIANIEAMAAGTPVASFGVGGMLEYLVPDTNSLIFNTSDPHVVATELAELLSDTPRLERIGARARDDVMRNFRAEEALDRWASLYEALANGLEASNAARETL